MSEKNCKTIYVLLVVVEVCNSHTCPGFSHAVTLQLGVLIVLQVSLLILPETDRVERLRHISINVHMLATSPTFQLKCCILPLECTAKPWNNPGLTL